MAPTLNELVDSEDSPGNIVGFWQGLWQEFIAPINFVMSLYEYARLAPESR